MPSITDLITGGNKAPVSAPPNLDIVKENIESMIQQGAPEADIDAYIASEGVTLDDLHAESQAGQGAPWSTAQEAMDMLTMGGQSKLNAAGIGLIDATTGALQGKGWDFSTPYNRELAESRASQEQYGKDNPISKRVGQGAGLAVGIAGLPAVTALKGSGLIPQIANTAATGGVYGAGAGALQDADSMEERGSNALWGGGIGMGLGPLSIPIAKGIGKAASYFRGAPQTQAPTVPQLRAEKNAAYTASKDIGLTVKPEAINTMADDVAAKFADDAFDADLEPKAAILLKRVTEARDKPLTLTELDNLRKKAVRLAKGDNKEEAHFAGKVIESIDDFMDNLNAAGVESGDPKAANAAITNARDLAKRTRKAEMMETAFKKAENAVGANYSQAGMQTALQQQFRRILDDPKKLRLFNSEEQEAITAVVHGNRTQKVLNILKKLAPSNSFALIGATVNPTLGVPGLMAGQMAKTSSAKMTSNAAGKADYLVRAGKPMPKAKPTANPQLQSKLRGLLSVQAGRVGGLLGSI